MSTCPVCGKDVDPIRAPAVAVKDGKIVGYCSKDCLALAEFGPKLIPTKVVWLPSDKSGDKAFTPPSGVPEGTTPNIETGPVIEVVAEASRDDTKARRRHRADSVQIADTGHLDDYVTHEPRKRGLVLAIVLLVVAGGAAAAYFLGVFGGRGGETAVAQAPRSDAAVVAPVVIDAPLVITRDDAVAQAQAVLRAQLGAVPRVARVAASALARTGDKDSLEVLAKALAAETSDLGKVELAYVLARAGDKRGTDALMLAASPAKREAKHEAGRRLALLGDARAIKVLESSLQYPQFRLGIAEQLAYLAEPRALKVLDDVRADPKALPDDKARAVIALGWAGRADIAPALHDLLADDRNNAFAAPALANLHDEAARPVLIKQLAIPSLRVQAARGLRRLAPDADLSALLPALVAALASNKDTEQLQLAEALLLLAGPAAWSERE